jgi:hypothetical protein
MKTNRQTLSTPTSAAGVSGDSPNGAGGGLFFAIFMHGALTALTAFTMIIILTGGL